MFKFFEKQTRQDGGMNVLTAIKLVIALARIVEVDPVELAKAFKEDPECQEYFDLLVKEQANV